MKRGKLFFKSIGYSFRLIYRSSKLFILIYMVFNLACATFPLLSFFVLKYLLDILIMESPQIPLVIFCMVAYVVALVILQGLNSAKNVVYDSVFKKAEFLYDRELLKKLSKLPLSFLDSSSGKDMVNDVRYARNTAVYLTYRIVQITT